MFEGSGKFPKTDRQRDRQTDRIALMALIPSSPDVRVIHLLNITIKYRTQHRIE